MKDTIKNSIIGAFAIFGLVALISSSNTAPTLIHEGTTESHVWAFRTDHSAAGDVYLFNKVTGEARYLTGNPSSKEANYWELTKKN